MAKKSTFRLNLPSDVQHEVYVLQLADGTTVTRKGTELAAAPATSGGAPRG